MRLIILVLLLAFSALSQDYLPHRRKAFRPAAAGGGGGGDVAWRSTSDVRGTATDATVAEPAGAASGDIFIAVAHCAAAGTLTAPSGWTVLTNGTQTFDGFFDYNVAWIRRGGSAPSLTWTTGSSVYREVFVHAFSGGKASGDAIEVMNRIANNGGASGNPDPGAVTTVNDNALLFVAGINWSGSAGGGWVAGASYTIRGNNTAGNNTANASRSAGLISPAGATDPATFTGGPGAGNAWEAFTYGISD